jgi:hypothetical protein
MLFPKKSEKKPGFDGAAEQVPPSPPHTVLCMGGGSIGSFYPIAVEVGIRVKRKKFSLYDTVRSLSIVMHVSYQSRQIDCKCCSVRKPVMFDARHPLKIGGSRLTTDAWFSSYNPNQAANHKIADIAGLSLYRHIQYTSKMCLRVLSSKFNSV